jgi:hypothetical protein
MTPFSLDIVDRYFSARTYLVLPELIQDIFEALHGKLQSHRLVTLNGFPHLVDRSTFRRFGGMRYPFVRFN